MTTGQRRKYHPDALVKMLRKAASLRNDMLAEGFTDNGGAIHSAERILNLLGLALVYPTLSHQNNVRHLPDAEFSSAARDAHSRGERVFIEHVAPIRALTREVIARIVDGSSDDDLKAFVQRAYRLVLLTADETRALNKTNRSRITPDRLGDAGILVVRVAK